MRSVFTEDDQELVRLQNAIAPETAKTRIAPEKTETDDYTNQIAKDIPVEVVSFYTAIFALWAANQSHAAAATVGYIVFFVSVFGTILYSWLKNTKDKVPNLAIKVGMATIAFIIWAYTLWWPFAAYIPQDTFIGGVLVLVYLFASPGVYACITTLHLRSLKKKDPNLTADQKQLEPTPNPPPENKPRQTQKK